MANIKRELYGYKYKGLCQGEAFIEDQKREKPRLVKRYALFQEQKMCEWILWALLFISVTIFGLFIKNWFVVVSCGLLTICYIYVVIRELVILVLMKRKIKSIVALGTRYPAEIVQYEVVPSMGYGSFSESKRIYYRLEVQLVYEGEILNVKTPPLKYNPLAVLKSPRCSVYIYEGEFSVVDYDFRTDKKDSKIELKKVMNWDEL